MAFMLDDWTYMSDDNFLLSDDQEGLMGAEREMILLTAEQELREAQRELHRVLPQRDSFALLAELERSVATFTKEFGTPTGASVEEKR
jgi:hypothetical protein